MAHNGFKVFDSDMHLKEPSDLWERYIDPKFKHRAPKGSQSHPLDFEIIIDGKICGAPPKGKSLELITQSMDARLPQYAEEAERNFDSVAQVIAMDKEGIDITVIYPSNGLYVNSFQDMDAQFSLALAQAYNNWHRDFLNAGDPKRMYGAALLPFQDVSLAVTEARRAVKDLGFKSIFLRPQPPKTGVYWHHSVFDPLWAEIQELGVPVIFHEGVCNHMPEAGKDRFSLTDEIALLHSCVHPMELMMAIDAFTMGGVLERFPRLKVGFLEGNGSWLPYWLWRLDEHCEYMGIDSGGGLKLKPSESFLRSCYVSVDCDETTAPYAIDAIGDNNFVFSTDYPHLDAKYPNATETFLQMPISEEGKRKILWDNCASLYGF